MKELDESRLREAIDRIRPPAGLSPDVRRRVLAQTGRRRDRRWLLAPAGGLLMSAVALLFAAQAAQPPAPIFRTEVENVNAVMAGFANDEFRPVAPNYLPEGARLTEVRLARPGQTGRIEGIDLQFTAADGRRIDLRQQPSAISMRPAAPAAEPSRAIVINGQSWTLYNAGSANRTVLVRQGDDLTVLVEGNLTEDEIVRLAGGLRPPARPVLGPIR